VSGGICVNQDRERPASVRDYWALTFLLAFAYKIVAVEPRSVMEAKRWIGRIVFGTIGVEVAGTLTHALIATIPGGAH
jgi:hypothetical protein